MSEETIEKTSAFATLAAKAKKDTFKLPRIEYFRVDIDKGTGTASNWHATGYVLQVKVQGIDGMYLAGSVGAYYGMNVKSKYKTEDEARAAGFDMKKKWGREKAVKASKKLTPAERVAKMTAEERNAFLEALMAAA